MGGGIINYQTITSGHLHHIDNLDNRKKSIFRQHSGKPQADEREEGSLWIWYFSGIIINNVSG